jgi:hypothetical protein
MDKELFSPLKSPEKSRFSFFKPLAKPEGKDIPHNAKVNFTILSKLEDDPSQTYLCLYEPTNRLVIVKVFPYINGAKNPLYLREGLLDTLNHATIITCFESKPKLDSFNNKRCVPYSLVMTDYAPQGDLQLLVSRKIFEGNVILLRTMMNHLIAAMVYIH